VLVVASKEDPDQSMRIRLEAYEEEEIVSFKTKPSLKYLPVYQNPLLKIGQVKGNIKKEELALHIFCLSI
jgi:hypothetical protein